MEAEKYKCSMCANQQSPLCELCSVIKSPSGREHKPKYFVGITEIALPLNKTVEKDALVGLSTAIQSYANSLQTIPIVTVLKYNALLNLSKSEE